MQPPRAGPKPFGKQLRGREGLLTLCILLVTININPQDLRIYNLRNKELQMYWQTRQRRRMGEEVTKFQYKNFLRMVSKGEGNPGPRVTLARGFKVLWLRAKFPRKPTRVKRINRLN